MTRQEHPGQRLLTRRLLLLAAVLAMNGTWAADIAMKRKPVIHLDCNTEASPDYAGVAFSYVIDEDANNVKVSRWGEAVDVEFGPAFITYRTLGMGLKMTVAIERETWKFTMLHKDGVFLVTGSCTPAKPGLCVSPHHHRDAATGVAARNMDRPHPRV